MKKKTKCDERFDLLHFTFLSPDMTAKERFEILRKRYSYSEISYEEGVHEEAN